MKESWFYTSDGISKGPVNSDKIADLVLKGLLKKSDKVQALSTGLWVTIIDQKEIQEIINRPMAKPLINERAAVKLKTYLDEEGLRQELEFVDLKPIFWVTNWKLIPLWGVLSLGVYQLYWFLRQWLARPRGYTKKNDLLSGLSIMILFFPFTIFFSIESEPHFRKILLLPHRPTLLAVIWIIGELIGMNAFQFPIARWIAALLSLLFFVMSVWPLMVMQRYINECNEALGRRKQAS